MNIDKKFKSLEDTLEEQVMVEFTGKLRLLDNLDFRELGYITLKNGEEYFFDGGEYIKMADNKIVLKVNSNYEHVQLVHHNKDGYTVYRSRLFVVKSENMKGGTICSKKDATEYEKIIKTQQEIIEKMNIQMKKQHKLILKFQNQKGW